MKEIQQTLPLRTAFYIRVSTEEQDEKYGKDLQKSALIALLNSKAKLSDDNTEGYAPPLPQHIYYDDISGTLPMEGRIGMLQMHDDILNAPQGTRPFDVIFVYKLDRLARKLRILLEIIDFLDDHKVQIVSARENIDTSTPFGRAMLGILGVIAELEIETIKDRTHAGKMAAVMKGVAMQNIYGYDRREGMTPVINETEADIVRRIFNMWVFNRSSLYQIAETFKLEHILTPLYSKKPEKIDRKNAKNPPYFWSASKVRDILTDEVYIGNYYYGKTKNKKPLPKEEWTLSPIKFPQVVDLVTFEKAQNLLGRSNQTIPQDDRRNYLLKSLLKCDDCFDPQKDIQGRVTWHGVPERLKSGKMSFYYKCRRKNASKGGSRVCKMLPLPMGEINNFIIKFIKNLLRNPQAVFDYQQNLKSTKLETQQLIKKLADLDKALNAKPAVRANLLEQHADGHITREELGIALEKSEKSEQELSKQRKEVDEILQTRLLEQGYIDALDAFATTYLAKLETLDNDSPEFYQIVHMLIEEIIVYGRPCTEKDSIAGQKKLQQSMPYKLHIKLRLPQQFLEDLAIKRAKELDEEIVPKGIKSDVKKSSW